jgi:hypothetical protein
MYNYANTTAVVRYEGRLVRVEQGDAYLAEDPFVVANPGLFNEVPTNLRSSIGTQRAVETATAKPGEKRAGKIRG